VPPSARRNARAEPARAPTLTGRRQQRARV